MLAWLCQSSAFLFKLHPAAVRALTSSLAWFGRQGSTPAIAPTYRTISMKLEKPVRTEIWLRKIHAPFAEDKTLTTIFRPERRLLSEQHPHALGLGERAQIRIIDKVGARWANVSGVLLPTPNMPIVITDVTVKRLGSIEAKDFIGSTPDVKDLIGLKIQLGLIYNLSEEDLNANCWVTRTTFEYI
jgi:hypothetical protein